MENLLVNYVVEEVAMFPKNFIAATEKYGSYYDPVPDPYLRKSFTVAGEVKDSKITICGLGFYKLFINGKEITKGFIAPYLSNPDHIMYYDSYDLKEYLVQGENVLGILLGNGHLNYSGAKVWQFHLASYRSAPKVALELTVDYEDGRKLQFTADESFKTHPSPILFEDFRLGEYYDARCELPGWNLPGFDDGDWKNAIPAVTPKGEAKICTAEPIVLIKKLTPVSVRKGCIGAIKDNLAYPDSQPLDEADKTGYIYDFGENLAGIVRLKIKGEKGQRLSIQTCEKLDSTGNLDLRMISAPIGWKHRMIYILRGEGEEEYAASFTFFGMRYCLVSGLTEEQATEDLLTFEVLSSGLQKNGDFYCSDEVINKLQKATYNADISNFYYFPMDCPHREKNGWTGDAAISCEQMLFNLTPENSYRVWLDNMRKAQKESGELPGIVPTSCWGYSDESGEWNGPGWDSALIYLPYYTWLYRGRTDLVEDNVDATMKYLAFLKGKRDRQGLLELGLFDYVPIQYKLPLTPLIVSSTLIAMDICEKCDIMFRAIGRVEEAEYASGFRAELRTAARKVLIEADGATVLGRGQGAQAMGIAYGLFEPGEIKAAMDVLLHYIEETGGRMDFGVLASRVIFHVLAQNGYAELAFRMIAGPEYPSYGHWIVYEDATTLFESFKKPNDPDIGSKNHHFWGDISSWFFKHIAGVKINPYARDVNELEISPNFISTLDHAGGYQNVPAGKVEVKWERNKHDIELTVTVPEGCYGFLRLPDGYYIQERFMVSIKRLESGTATYHLQPQRERK